MRNFFASEITINFYISLFLPVADLFRQIPNFSETSPTSLGCPVIGRNQDGRFKRVKKNKFYSKY